MIEPARERGGGDHDVPYTWHRHPTTYLSPRWMPMLVALRGLVQDARAGVPSTLFKLSKDQDMEAE